MRLKRVERCRTYCYTPEFAHDRLQRLLILFQQRIQLFILMLQLLILGDEMGRERFELCSEFLCSLDLSQLLTSLAINVSIASEDSNGEYARMREDIPSVISTLNRRNGNPAPTCTACPLTLSDRDLSWVTSERLASSCSVDCQVASIIQSLSAQKLHAQSALME